MSNETLFLIVLVILTLSVLPSWPYSSEWGYGPTSGLVVVLAIFLIWAIVEERPLFRSTGEDLKVTAQDAGHDLQSAGRDAAASIRGAVQQ